MTRRKVSREVKLEAVELVTERGVTVAEACRDGTHPFVAPDPEAKSWHSRPSAS